MCLATVGAVPNRCWALPLCWGMGKDAGVVTVVVKTGALGMHDHKQLKAENPDYMLEDFRDILGIVLQHEKASQQRVQGDA